ncbi:hypothetical protein O3P69_013430 [Scylla paramamosain]|uniref:Uncharacterized protein n=1 Tax=Scylla paramamosain TaxID=85552 RepID=A0AAW0U280_SCYPA
MISTYTCTTSSRLYSLQSNQDLVAGELPYGGIQGWRCFWQYPAHLSSRLLRVQRRTVRTFEFINSGRRGAFRVQQPGRSLPFNAAADDEDVLQGTDKISGKSCRSYGAMACPRNS